MNERVMNGYCNPSWDGWVGVRFIVEKGCGRVKLGRMWGLWLTPGVADRAARSSDQKVLGGSGCREWGLECE